LHMRLLSLSRDAVFQPATVDRVPAVLASAMTHHANVLPPIQLLVQILVPYSAILRLL
jgi:hypothetical protein